MIRITGLFFVAASFVLVSSQASVAAQTTIIQKSEGLPITAMNITLRVGSADDPKGQEGLAHLTARLMREGGVVEAPALDGGKPRPARSRAEIEELLFPLSAEIDASSDKEQISFTVLTTGDDAPLVLGVLSQMITNPAFDSGELDRLRSETLDALEKQLPRENEEELGKAALDRAIYGPDHPYGHAIEGTVAGVKKIDRGAIRAFYKSRFTRARLTIGLAGVVTAELERQARLAFASLESGESGGADQAEIPEVAEKPSVHLTIIKGPFEAVGAHLGQPLPFNRSSPDFPAMYLASWAFGKHRSFVGRLMSHVREIRGLDYGAYSYVENFPHGGEAMIDPTQAARARQAFTVWARPTTMPNGCFLLRQIYRETNLLATQGLTRAEFSLTKSHLIGNAPLLATGLERRLGYAIDSAFYGIKGDFLASLQRNAQALTYEKVNGLLRKYIHPKHLDLVVVTPNPDEYKEQVLGAKCDIHYGPGIVKGREVTDEDKVIARYSLGLQPERIEVLEAASIFEK